MKKLFLSRAPLLDVRAPVEFATGALPEAVNLPIMNDEERALVGTAYKRTGREAAIKLGHELVSGAVREERIERWIEQIRLRKDTVIYCFRGGLRSQITQRWLSERGVHRPLIEGGYKRARRFLREELERFSRENPALVLSGPTGSGKTHLLKEVSAFYPMIDLEALAGHKGSAFGAGPLPQPNQVDFENALAVRMMNLNEDEASKPRRFLVEDESRLIGRCALPESLFSRMRASEAILVEVSFERRVENIFQDYILQTAIGRGERAPAVGLFGFYSEAVKKLSKKLGGARAQEILRDMEHSKNRYLDDEKDLESNKAWIEKILSFYYDPLYAGSFARRNPKIAFQGACMDVLSYLKSES